MVTSDMHYRLLKILEEKPDLSQRELAQELGISLGKVNYCLAALMEKGWLKARKFQHSNNKLGYAYLLTPRGVKEKAELTVDFLRRKVAEYEALEREIAEMRQQVKINRARRAS